MVDGTVYLRIDVNGSREEANASGSEYRADVSYPPSANCDSTEAKAL